MAGNFAHLHVHTEYSLLDGACRINELLQSAAEKGLAALAITDHGNMYGVIDFYKEAQKVGVKPIIGYEAYLAERTRHDREGKKDDSPSHLVLLAKNLEGYKNLLVLASKAFLEGFYYKPRIDWELLQEHHSGLIVLSSCLAGEIPRLLLQDRYEDAVSVTGRYVDLVGKGNFFLELQDHGM
ncbi:MAG TPA: PHP domain-containing protein, partial [Clostridia bacterium]|nr:PHP domain-containing protein [Clostridia bacterium]